MKQTIKRMSCLLLALCLLLTLVPVSARAEEERPVIDFVLVLDCSRSMRENDKMGLAADACKMFMDLLPIEDARISVIAFGYTGGGYDFEHFNVTYDANLVHVLSPLKGNMTTEEKTALKNSIVTAKEQMGDNTPVGQALAAGVDTLLKGGATDGNACVILLSDGGATSPIAVGETISLADNVPYTAKEHEWPIYCIELDYKNENETASGKDNRARLNNICVNSGAGADGRMKVNDPADVCEAFLKIFNRFMEVEGNDPESITIGSAGVAELSFEVPNLASEANVVISGSAVDYVELINNAQGTTKQIKESENSKNLVANVEPGSYFSVKMICPAAGTWTVKAYGDPNAEILVYNNSMQELGLTMVTNPDGSGRLTKNDKIDVQAYFTYSGTNLNNNTFYLENNASLIVTSYTDEAKTSVKGVREFTMEGSESGFHYSLPVSEVPSGTFTVQVLLKHDMFRNGEKLTDSVTFVSENLPMILAENAAPIERNGYVNGQFEDVDLTTIFNNPDGDPVEYVLTCTSDRTASFECTVTEQDMLQISAGMVPGTYQMQIEATDPDMTEPLVYTGLTLTVENRSMETKKIPDQEVWVDYYDGFPAKQDPSNTVLDIDLNDYFTDPDGVELTFGDITADVAGLVNASWQAGKLHVEPVAKGDVVLTTTVSDGIETVEAKLEIEVVSGKAVYWATHWIYYVIAVAIVIALLLIYLYVKGHTTMKGSWKVTIKRGYDTITTGTGLKMSSLSTVKKAKSKPFAAKDLVNETMAWMQDQGGLRTAAAPFLSMKEFEAIKFQGIYSGLGFMVLNVPGGDTIEVEYNSQIKPKTKKFRVNTGELRITIKRKNDFGVDDSLTILLENTGK